MKKPKTLYGVVSTVDGEYNHAAVTTSLAKAKAEFRAWMKEHDTNPEGPEYDKERIEAAVREGFFDDGSGYTITLAKGIDVI